MNLNFFYKPKKKSQKDEESDLLLPQDKKAIKKLSKEKSKHLRTVEELNQEITLIQNSTGTLIPKFVRLHNNLRQKYRWYYNWHVNPYAKTVHWFVLLLYILSLPLIYYYITASPFPQKTKATGYDFPRWEWKNPTPTGSIIRGVTADSQNFLWLVGDKGLILRYNGSTWQENYSGTNNNLTDITVASPSDIWTVGNSGIIIKYNGISWTSQNSGLVSNISSVYAISQSIVWAVSNTKALKTTDGGTNWQSYTIAASQFNDIWALDENTAVAIGNSGKIYKTTNGGTSWSEKTSSTSNNLLAIAALNSNTLIVSGDRKIIKSIDGGETWSTKFTDITQMTLNYGAIVVINSQTVLVIGEPSAHNTAYKSIDAGDNWVSSTYPISSYGITTIRSLVAIGNIVWGAGEVSTTGTRGAIFKSTNGGDSWSEQTSGTAQNLSRVQTTADGSTIYAVGNNETILKSTNNGSSWTDQSQFTGDFTYLYGLDVVDANNVWVTGRTSGRIFKTTNGGTNWSSTVVAGSWNDIDMVDATTGWIVGDDGKIYKTTNGTDWTAQTSGIIDNITDVAAVSSNVAWASTAGSALRTSDGGESWSQLVIQTTIKVQALSSNTAYFLASYGDIAYTTNAGNDWSTIESLSATFPGLTFVDFQMLDSNNIWVLEENGRIFKTTNGGTSWNELNTPVSTTMNNLFITDSNNYWMAGNDGRILNYHSPANATATKFAIKFPGQSFADDVGVYGTPNAVQAGDSVTATIYAVDGDNVLDISNTSWAGFTTTDPNDSNPASIQLTEGVLGQPNTCVQNPSTPTTLYCGIGSATFTFHTPGNWTITASDVYGVLSSGTSSQITVTAGDATKLSCSNCPTSLDAGAVSGAISVNLQDLYGNNTTSGSSKTIALSTSSSRGKFSQSINGPWSTGSKNITIPAGSTSATFYYYDFSTGSQTITATTDGLTSASCTFTINTGTLSESTLTVDKNSLRAGETLNATVTIKNNVGAALPDKTVQLSSSRNTDSSTPDVFSASSQITNSDGVSTFTVRPTAIGSFVLSAYDQSDSLYISQEQTINVSAGVLSKIVLESNATEVKPGSTFYLTAKMYDGYDNIITNYTGEIQFTSSDREAKFEEKNHTFSASESGQYSQPVTLQTEGQQSITATAEGISGIVYVTVSLTATPIPTTSTPSAVPSAIITSPSPTSSPPTLLETFQESPVAQTISRILTPLTATVATLGLFPLLVQAFPQGFHILASLFPSIFTAAAARRRRKPWGLVFDSLRGKPVDLAVVRVFNAGSDRLVATKVTDQNGRFNFLLAKGKYYVTVTRAGYIFPPKISKLKANQLATRFGPQSDIYFGQSFVIGADDTNLNLNIALDPKLSTLSSGMQLLMGLKNGYEWFLIGLSYFAIPLMILGTVFAAVATIVIPSKFNLYLSGFYVALLASYLIINRLRSTRMGIVFNAKSRRPIVGATVLIFDKEYSAIREIKTTDQHGHFAILAQKGQYYLTVHASGYKFPSKAFEFKKGDKHFGTLYFGQTIHNKKPAFVNVSIPLDKS